MEIHDRMTKDVLILSWQRFHRDATALCRQLSQLKASWTAVVAISRNGLIPAAIASRELGVRRVELIQLDLSQKVSVSKSFSDDADGDGFLIFDAASVSGSTISAVRAVLPRAIFATVYATPQGAASTDFFAIKSKQSTRIQFPWEVGV